jgi:peptide/nickel transport system substrate-binding protein
VKGLSNMFKKQFKIGHIAKIEKVASEFTSAEKMIFYILAGIFILSTLIMLFKVNNAYMTKIPARGGSLTEGIIGTPRFINPLLSLSDADRDLTSLMYSGLMKPTPDGQLIPDLASGYSISEDGKTYDFTLRNDIYFHDGKKVTADDVEFTIKRAIDPALKSPRRASWEGVTIEKKDESHISFILKQPYAPFLENTTLGILPKHIWNNALPEEFAQSAFNTSPIGSGPYKFVEIKRNSAGIPTSYELTAFSKYAHGEPLISKINLRFYSNEDAAISALKRGDIESLTSISPEKAADLEKSNFNLLTTPLPRIFGVFFNETPGSPLSQKEVRQAMALAVPRDTIIQDVLHGYGTRIESPLPANVHSEISSSTPQGTGTTTERSVLAKNILEKAGWTLGENGIYEKKNKKETTKLSLTLSTSNAPELKRTAEILQSAWKAAGIEVEIAVFEPGDLNQNVIRPRKYDALLFGEVIGRDLDLYAFWHSSQRNDPGLNIAMYANSKVDKYLETARSTTDKEERYVQFKKFEDEIAKDIPAIFLYSPDFIYVVPNRVMNLSLGTIIEPKERFETVSEWYTNMDRVWKIFVKN